MFFLYICILSIIFINRKSYNLQRLIIALLYCHITHNIIIARKLLICVVFIYIFEFVKFYFYLYTAKYILEPALHVTLWFCHLQNNVVMYYCVCIICIW